MYCRKCGAKLIEDSQFCPKCGTRVEDSDSGANKAESEDPPAASEFEKPRDWASPPGEEANPLMFPIEEIETRRQAESEKTLPNAEKTEPASSAPSETASPKPAETSGKELPASLLPKPDGFANPNQQNTEVEKSRKKRKKRRKKSKKRGHPLDGYRPLRNSFRFGGCALLFFVVIVVPIASIGIWGWIQYNSFIEQKGFQSVVLQETNVILAPDNDTLYWGMNVLYEAEESDVEVAFIGNSWWLGGTFKEKVYFRGYQLFLEEGARFEKGLDVQAVFFKPGTAQIDGELTGNIGIQR